MSPLYECEWDFPCDCDDMAPEWEWCEIEGCYKCTSCGAVQ